jgi:tetratricopeptide (TPR) repeat protein
MEPEEKSH